MEVFEDAKSMEEALVKEYPDIELRDLKQVPGLFYNGKMYINAAHPYHNQKGGTETVVLYEAVGRYSLNGIINRMAAEQGKDSDTVYAELMDKIFDRYQDTGLMDYIAKTYFGKDAIGFTSLAMVRHGLDISPTKEDIQEFLYKFGITNEQLERYIGKHIEYLTKAELRAFSKINTSKRGEKAARLFFGGTQTSDRSASILQREVQDQINKDQTQTHR